MDCNTVVCLFQITPQSLIGDYCEYCLCVFALDGFSLLQCHGDGGIIIVSVQYFVPPQCQDDGEDCNKLNQASIPHYALIINSMYTAEQRREIHASGDEHCRLVRFRKER